MEQGERFIRIKEIRQRTGLGTSTIYKRMSEGTFPPQVSLGPRMSAWVESEIDAKSSGLEVCGFLVDRARRSRVMAGHGSRMMAIIPNPALRRQMVTFSRQDARNVQLSWPEICRRSFPLRFATNMASSAHPMNC